MATTTRKPSLTWLALFSPWNLQPVPTDHLQAQHFGQQWETGGHGLRPRQPPLLGSPALPGLLLTGSSAFLAPLFCSLPFLTFVSFPSPEYIVLVLKVQVAWVQILARFLSLPRFPHLYSKVTPPQRCPGVIFQQRVSLCKDPWTALALGNLPVGSSS